MFGGLLGDSNKSSIWNTKEFPALKSNPNVILDYRD